MTDDSATAAVRPDRFIEGALSDLPRDVLRKILHDNAARIYHLD